MPWGRPRKGETGTKRLDMRMRRDLKDKLNKITKGRRTAFVERTMEPILEKLDPGKPCKVVCRISEVVTDAKRRSSNAVRDNYLDDALAYLNVARAVETVLAPYASLCECSSRSNNAKNNVKKTVLRNQI